MKVDKLLALALVTVAGNAAAERIDFTKLPQGTVSTAPGSAERPTAIPASETTPGIYAEGPPSRAYDHHVEGMTTAYLFGSEEAAQDHRASSFSPAREQAPAACLTVREYYSSGRLEEEEWPQRFQQQVQVQGVRSGTKAASVYGYMTGLAAVRLERLEIAGDGSATLHSVDAWVDAVTRGVRRIREDRLPLGLVSEGPHGVKVFAAREAKGAVHFVVHRPLENVRMPISRHWTIQAGGGLGHSDCGHARIRLAAVPGLGETAELRIDLPLSVSDVESGESASEERGIVQILAGQKPARQREIRVRALRVNLSLSQTASDPTPVSSVSFSWDGAEQRMTSFF